MKHTSKILGLALLSVGAFTLAPAAHADDWGQRRSEYHRMNRYDDDDRYTGRFNPHDVRFYDDDRVVVQQYYEHGPEYREMPGRGHHKGVYKKQDRQKVVYVIGQPLPPTIVYQPLPPELLGQLRPAPRGYQYVRVDRDVLLISQASKNVIDAITLLSAVGH